MAHPGGRPTKYNPSMVQIVRDYITECNSNQMRLPKRVDVAIRLGIDDETIIEWEKRHPEFYAAIKEVDRLQKGQLMDDGMYGGKEVNSTMAIFLLKANHGMVETSKLEVDGQIKQIIITEDEDD